MQTRRKRQKTIPRLQRDYWDALSDEYARITRISDDDFHYGPQIPGESELRILPAFPAGAASLELGCGGGQNSVFLARRGLKCTAMDISERQLARARARAAARGLEIDFKLAALETFESALRPDQQFDFVHSSHALEFVDDPAPVVRRMAARTKPGGFVVVSTVNPLFNGEWITGTFEGENAPEDAQETPGMFLTSYFRPPDDVRDDAFGHAVSRAWPVSSWFGWFAQAGLRVTALLEPPATTRAPYTSDDWADHGGELDEFPSTLVIAGAKP